MTLHSGKLYRWLLLVLLVLVVAGAAVAWAHVTDWSITDLLKKKEPGGPAGERELGSSARPVPGMPDTLELPDEVVKKLGVVTVPARAATEKRLLELSGSLNLDPDRLQRVHTYFPGEVVEIGNLDVSEITSPLHTVAHQIHYGDKVMKGQLLAVLYNADLGSKKNDLVDALSQLKVDQKKYKDIENAYKSVAATEGMLRQARRDVETDLNNARRAESYLRTYRVPKEEIDAVKVEAERIFENGGKHDPEKEKNWPRVELRAKMDGRILERNVALGDSVTDTTMDLFKIADLSRVLVLAKVYEEDLPALRALKPDERHWSIRAQNEPEAPALRGMFDTVSYIIDPVEHTAQVRGWVENINDRYLVGQFITASVELPPSPNEVAIPTTALVEDGNESTVFVRADPNKPQFTQKRVAVAHRGQDLVYLRSKLKPDQVAQGFQVVLANESVVSAGAIQIKAALEDLGSAAKK